jgi:transcriptional regulator with XRE-family HTH domain
MEQYNFSLGRLARYADCSKGFISHLLSGRRSSCTPALATRIAEALNVPLEVLFDAKATPTDMSNVKENAA